MFYLVNRFPSSTLEDKTSFKSWYRKRSSLSNIRIFGSDAYMHVLKEKIGKFDSKVVKYIFIGYKEGVKGYKHWNPETKVYSWDVVFREFGNIPKYVFLPKNHLKKVNFDCMEGYPISSQERRHEPKTQFVRRLEYDTKEPKRYDPSNFFSLITIRIT